ncbi:MAG: hypothetical protein AAGJ11_16430 [Bacteroidota bacterium]
MLAPLPPLGGSLVLLAIPALLLLAACSEATPEADPPDAPFTGVVWEEVPGNPSLATPVCPEWNCLGMTDPWLGRAPDGETVLWVSAGGDAATGGPVVARASGPTASEVTFGADAPQLLPDDAAWDRWRETVALRFDPEADRWTMWYLGYNQSFFDDPAIGQSVSTDAEGTAFVRPEAPIYRPAPGAWDGRFVADPTPIRLPDGSWRLYYTGAGTTVGVGVLESDDGETWTPYAGNPVFERDLGGWDQGFIGIDVQIVDGRYLMWYSGYEEPLDLETTPISIGLAVSDDGLSWQRYEDNPVIEPGASGTWNELRIVSPSVRIEADGSFTMALHGQNRADAQGRSLGRIGLYRSARVDP